MNDKAEFIFDSRYELPDSGRAAGIGSFYYQKEHECLGCGKKFMAKSPNCPWCPECRPAATERRIKASTKKQTERRAKRNRERRIEAGNAQKHGVQ
jgi:hypothetical protein